MGPCALTGQSDRNVGFHPQEFPLLLKACNVSPSSVFFDRAIERIYKEHCEENSKEKPNYLDSSLSDDLMMTDSTMWAKVPRPITF